MLNKKLPNFKISGKLASDIVNINEEVDGTLIVEVNY
jgi:hypothetical protein